MPEEGSSIEREPANLIYCNRINIYPEFCNKLHHIPFFQAHTAALSSLASMSSRRRVVRHGHGCYAYP